MHPQERQIVEQLVVQIMQASEPQRELILQELDPKMVQLLITFMGEQLPDEETRRQFVTMIQSIAKGYKPQNDRELWRYFRDECGLRIPRVATCEGHCAPFTFAADVYFERGLKDKVAVGNRGGGKTIMMGALHAINSRTKANLESAFIGAIEMHADKGYTYLKMFLERESWKGVVDPKKMQKKETTFANGSKVFIVTGTMSGVNSPHPQVAHFDEIELFRGDVYEEAIHMAQSAHGYRAQNIGTSSWKKPKGRLTQIINEVNEAIQMGAEPPYELYRWCWAESSQKCEHDCNDCPFKNIIKGTWEDGSPRTFESVCKRGSLVKGQGKLKRSDGFVPLEDAIGRFKKLSRRQWESQQESRRPTTEDLVYDVFDEDLHFIENWDPDPDYGVIDVGMDFGGTNPHAVTFWQHLDVEVELPNGRRIPEGADVCFDQIYEAQMGNVELGKRINQRIMDWQQIHPKFHVTAFYCDPAAKAARLDLMRLSAYGGGMTDPLFQPIRTIARGKVKVGDRVTLVYNQVRDDLLYIDKKRCPDVADEILSYEKGSNGEPKKEHDHAMDAMGYRFWNRHASAGRATSTATGKPQSLARPAPDRLGLRAPAHRIAGHLTSGDAPRGLPRSSGPRIRQEP